MSTTYAASAPMRGLVNYTPNDALQRDAGALAAAVARIFPRPHTGYFESDAGKRRLIVFLAMSQKIGPESQDALATWSMKRLLAHYAPQSPYGFVEALRRASGTWSETTYHGLLTVLGEGGEGSKTLRHLSAITPSHVQALLALPAPMRTLKIVALLPNSYYADLAERTVRRGYGRHPDPIVMRRLVQRLERAASTQGLFAWLIDAIGVGRITPPPIPGAPWLRPILDVRDIERTALKFQNCLRTRTPMMLKGQAAYFEVVGEEPAVVEVLVNKRGVWGIGEIRGHANDDVSATLLEKILAYLRVYGAVRAGAPDRLALELAEAAGW